jgi:Putative zinc-finger
MDCRAFRQLHGDWVDDLLDPTERDTLAQHIVMCAPCARFDTLARRALMVARSTPQIEVSAEFSGRLAARIAEERRRRIASHAPSHAERPRFVPASGSWVRAAAVVVVIAGGTMLARTSTSERGASTSALLPGIDSSVFLQDVASPLPAAALQSRDAASFASRAMGEIVVVRAMRPVGGALLPRSDDPLLDGDDRASLGDISATSVAATAPLWPTAQMAAHAANRFAAMEFGDILPVSVMQSSR